MRKKRAVKKAALPQQRQPLLHILWTIGPRPDKDAQPIKLRLRLLAHHHAGYFCPRVHAAHSLLYMPLAEQEQLTLQHAIRQYAVRGFRN